MKKTLKYHINSKVLLFILTIISIVSLILSVTVKNYTKPFKMLATIMIVPLQEGVNHIGSWFVSKSDTFQSVKKLTEKNKELQKKIEDLSEQNSLLSQNKYELERLRTLYDLDKDYSEYHKIGATVIGKDSGNWFHTFIVNKGTDDGVQVNMNVISGGGLVGIVYDVGKNYAKVRSLIDDDSDVSVCLSNVADTGMVHGDLKLMDQGYIRISNIDVNVNVEKGGMLMTSQISNKFLPGIPVGYIESIAPDSNDLTQSGTIIPIVDFKHINEVLIITQLKENLKD